MLTGKHGAGQDMHGNSHLLWRVARATALVVAAVIGLATFWLLSGMGFYFVDPVGDKPLVAVLFYTTMAVVILLTGRWVIRRV